MNYRLSIATLGALVILSGCGGPRLQEATLTYDMIPSKRPAGATTYQIQGEALPNGSIAIPGMTAAAEADVRISISAEPVKAVWTTQANQILYEAEGYDQNKKPIMLCREWASVGLSAPAKAVPTVAIIALWKQGGLTQSYEVTLTDRAGTVIDKDSIQSGTLIEFGKPVGSAKAITIIGSSDYASTSGGVMSSMSGQTSAHVVQQSAQDAEKAIPYRHERVWIEGEATTSIGQSVISEKGVTDWCTHMRQQPHAELEAALTEKRPALEQQAQGAITENAIAKVTSLLAAKLGSGSTTKQITMAIYDKDPAFLAFSQAITSGNRGSLTGAQQMLSALSQQADTKPLKRAVANYDLAQLALALGNTEQARKLANQAADEALGLGGGLFGEGDDDFTVAAMDFSISLGTSESGKPAKATHEKEPSTLKKVNGWFSSIGF